MIKFTGPWKTPTLKMFNFPCGETSVTVSDLNSMQPNVSWFYESDVELLQLLFIADALKREGQHIHTLFIPYFPFARQDRVANEGEAFTLKVAADLVNMVGAEEVIVLDPHSDVVAALVNNIKIETQADIFAPFFAEQEIRDFKLVACDAGAQKKIYKLAQKLNAEVISCDKRRNTKTGEITGVVVHTDDLKGQTCVMVDDICDGGRSFIEVAKGLKEKNAGKIILMVTHGFFTKGLEVFDGLIDEIYTRSGKVAFVPFNPAKETK